MPAQTTKSKLAAKLGDKGRKAVAAVAGNTTVMSVESRMPAGVDNGVAQLKVCKFELIKEGKPHAGEFQFIVQGRAVSPDSVNGARVKGQLTSLWPEPLCDTPEKQGKNSRKTLQEHFDHVCKIMRSLGLDTSDATLDNIEEKAAALQELGPYFHFRTWKGQPATTGPYKGKEPLTNHDWGQALSDDEVADIEGRIRKDADDATEDNTGDQTDEPEEQNDEQEGSNNESSDESNEEGGEDLEALGEAADADDEDAQKRITALAEEHGISGPVKKAKNWSAGAALIQKAIDAADESEAEASDESEEDDNSDKLTPPEKGEVYKWKKEKKLIQVEVVSVNLKASTVMIKHLDGSKKTTKDVAFTDLLNDD